MLKKLVGILELRALLKDRADDVGFALQFICNGLADGRHPPLLFHILESVIPIIMNRSISA